MDLEHDTVPLGCGRSRYQAVRAVLATSPPPFKRMIAALIEAQQPKQARKRRLTIAAVAKDAAKEGLVIVRVEYDQDGKIVGVVTGKSGSASIDMDDAPPIDRSEWN